MTAKAAIVYGGALGASITSVLCLGFWLPFRWNLPAPESCQLEVCVSNSGWHSNIIILARSQAFDWQTALPKQPIRSRYLAFGWGDRTFYRQPPTQVDQWLLKGFAALFLPTPAVMRVQGYYQLPHPLEVKCTHVSRTAYLRLVAFIQNSLQMDAHRQPLPAGLRPQTATYFYAAKGNYSLVHNSNDWTATGLRTAGINTPLWSGLSAAILQHFPQPCTILKSAYPSPNRCRQTSEQFRIESRARRSPGLTFDSR